MEKSPFSLRERLGSFKFAFNGIKLLFREHNARIHMFATFVVCLIGFLLNLSAMEWIIITITIGIVFAAEAFNTAIEKIADFISPERHEMIKEIKDLAAGAVLFIAISAAIVGIIIFFPKVIHLF